MVDTQVAPVAQARSRMGRVLEVIEERHEAGERPFVDVIEVVDAMEESGLEAFDIGIAVSRWFATASYGSLLTASVASLSDQQGKAT